jgi:hypothetical protein
MTKDAVKKTYQESAGEVKVCYEADVVVVGGGPGGHSAAMAAARNGTKTVLLERYGHLGGMAISGIVIQIPHMSDGGREPVIAGLSLEWLERLDAIEGGTLRPKMKDLGSSDPKLVKYWERFMGCVINSKTKHTAWAKSVCPANLCSRISALISTCNCPRCSVPPEGIKGIRENGTRSFLLRPRA